MPAILDSLFHKVVNTTSSFIGVEGGGWWGATKWRDLLIQNFFMPKWLHFQLHMPQNVATSIPHLTSQSCSDSLPGRTSWSHLQTTQAPMDARQACEWGLSNSRLLKLWQWYKHELLVNCCICRDLKLCVYKTPFGKSSHNYIRTAWHNFWQRKILWILVIHQTKMLLLAIS